MSDNMELVKRQPGGPAVILAADLLGLLFIRFENNVMSGNYSELEKKTGVA